MIEQRPCETDRRRELAGLGLKVGATFIPSLDGFAISENDLANVIRERDEARQLVEGLELESARLEDRIVDVKANADKLAECVKDMMHDLDIFYAKYREPSNKYLANVKQALAAYDREVRQ